MDAAAPVERMDPAVAEEEPLQELESLQSCCFAVVAAFVAAAFVAPMLLPMPALQRDRWLLAVADSNLQRHPIHQWQLMPVQEPAVHHHHRRLLLQRHQTDLVEEVADSPVAFGP